MSSRSKKVPAHLRHRRAFEKLRVADEKKLLFRPFLRSRSKNGLKNISSRSKNTCRRHHEAFEKLRVPDENGMEYLREKLQIQ